MRSLARQRIVERRDARAAEPVRNAFDALVLRAETEDEVAATLEMLWALDGAGAADRNVVERAFASLQPVVRTHALRVAERSFDSVLLASLLSRATEDPDEGVRVQAVLTAWRLDPTLRIAVLEPALRRDIGSREMRSAVIASLVGAESELLGSVVEGRVLLENSVAASAFAAEFTDVLLDDGSGLPSPSTLRDALATAAGIAKDRPWLAKAMLERIAAKQNLNAKEPRQLIAASEPQGWFTMLDRVPADLAIATPIDRNLFWPGREDVSFIAPKIVRAAELSLAEYGKRLYSNCMSCHQANGRGLPPVYPPLRGSEIVHGDPATLVKIVMHGLEGPIKVDGQSYNQVMPAAPLKSDEEIAAVLSYVRSAWGNTGEAIDAALVAKIRDETKGRNRPFTSKELGLAP